MRKTLEDIVNKKNFPAKKAGKEAALVPMRQTAEIGPVGRSRYMLWTVAFASVAFMLLALSFVWSSAEVNVYPKIDNVALDENFSASSLPGAALAFDLVKLSGEKTKMLKATEEKKIAEKATGIAVVFNSYSALAQRLDIDTRLSGSNGKLYKTKKPITVPGVKTDGTPGSVEVEIYAAEAGEEYNSGPLDFEIMGFTGTPKYEKFKVRSKTETEIRGGFVGTTLVATEADRGVAEKELSQTLKDELVKKVAGEIPDGFILFKDAAAFFTVDKIDLPLGTKELAVTLHGTLYGLLFKEDELTRKIAEKKVEDYEDGKAFISNLTDLKFTLGSIGDLSLEDMDSISFNLSGDAKIVWKLDTEKFTVDLLGQNKKDFISILSQYKNIDRAELALSPVWRRTIPDKPEKIKVIVNYPEDQ